MVVSLDQHGRPPYISVRRKGRRRLSARKRHLLDVLLPRIRVPETGDGTLDPAKLFGNVSEIWLEIGSGGGEHASTQALYHTDIGLLASEVFTEGIAKLLGQIEDANLKNIRIFDNDVRILLKMLMPNTIDRVFILFPDPWPKARHCKRRLVQPDFLDMLARAMKPEGRVRFATDMHAYADEALAGFVEHPAFAWTAKRADDWRIPPADHIETRYQRKNLGDICPVYYDFCIRQKTR